MSKYSYRLLVLCGLPCMINTFRCSLRNFGTRIPKLKATSSRPDSVDFSRSRSQSNFQKERRNEDVTQKAGFRGSYRSNGGQYENRNRDSYNNFGDTRKPRVQGDVKVVEWKRESDESSDNDLDKGERTGASVNDFDGDHLYGIAPVRLAISSQRRNITELLIQKDMDLSNKKDSKAANDIIDSAKSKGIPIKEVSKHDLNMLTESRPHQGFVLRASPLRFKKLDLMSPSESFKCVLALDEVWDPQNLGALLRTCQFLGCDKVVVCAKNSAPLSSVVSKASAGAMEVMDIWSTTNMMKFLDNSRKNGWQVVGTALSDESTHLTAIPLEKPTILVLGNEGFGIRTNVLTRCDHLVRLSGSGDTSAVDSLNVSVTGGILLHHFLSANNNNSKQVQG